MDYNTIIWYAAIAAAAIMALIVLTNIFTQVIKKIVNKEEAPAQAVVFVIAEILTFIAVAILCTIFGLHIFWYYWILAFIMGVLVAYGAMFGYDNLYKQLATAITNLIAAIFKKGSK